MATRRTKGRGETGARRKRRRRQNGCGCAQSNVGNPVPTWIFIMAAIAGSAAALVSIVADVLTIRAERRQHLRQISVVEGTYHG